MACCSNGLVSLASLVSILSINGLHHINLDNETRVVQIQFTGIGYADTDVEQEDNEVNVEAEKDYVSRDEDFFGLW
ncbi:hypothetical protein CHH91_17735 [Virgibacillus sp. 7505]|nr:hypothetical protein CHH91_17735 [Virgibacillus sp. 7505]